MLFAFFCANGQYISYTMSSYVSTDQYVFAFSKPTLSVSLEIKKSVIIY